MSTFCSGRQHLFEDFEIRPRRTELIVQRVIIAKVCGGRLIHTVERPSFIVNVRERQQRARISSLRNINIIILRIGKAPTLAS